MEPKILFDLFRGRLSDGLILSYPANDTLNARKLSYAELPAVCRRRALQLSALSSYRAGSVVLLHFEDHLDNILWFWTVLFAGCIPAFSTPLSADAAKRTQHMSYLATLLESPTCLTTSKHYDALAACQGLQVSDVKDMTTMNSTALPAMSAQPDDLAALMFTSGSTGLPKAVQITHRQLLCSLKGKASATSLTGDQTLLNFFGLDHVAGLTETHLLALYLRRTQVHVQPTDMFADPILFLRFITRHKVARTFAINTFLSNLLKSIQVIDPMERSVIDLSCLRQIVSGGEANPVDLCVQLDHTLQTFGAPKGIICPAFGMTETCAGCIYNLASPAFDVQSRKAFASLGKCVPGIEMRIVGTNHANLGGAAVCGQGMLQVRGPIVTTGYYRNEKATIEAFTEDGWFITGDEALIDEAGYLHIVGRLKDQVRINGLAVALLDVEACLNSKAIAGAVDNFYVCFGFRRAEDATERLAVCYLPAYESNHQEQRLQTNNAISQAVMQHSGVPSFVLPLDRAHLEKNTLGKISRAKVKTAFLKGELEEFEIRNDELVCSLAAEVMEPRSELESKLLEVFRTALSDALHIPGYTIGVSTVWSSLGVTSVQLILLKKRIEQGLGLEEVPLLLLMTNNTVVGLASALRQAVLQTDVYCSQASSHRAAPSAPNSAYMPVIKLRTQGSKPPIWLFHPGVGEVLVFVNLARYIEDRPVYALRARGFEQGETFFASIEDAVDTYYHAIKAVQPHGPYALAGYSYGAMLAFETAKRLESDGTGQTVGFLASFNLPPHIKFRMQQLDWTACACHLAHFLGLQSDPDTYSSHGIQPATRDAVLQYIFDSAPCERLEQLALSRVSFAHWADLAHSMQSMARSYEPSGLLHAMDVFYCTPLTAVAQSKAEWLRNHLSRWTEVCSHVRYHEVEGEHYTMIDAEHVDGFQAVFQKALSARGM